MTQLAVTVQRLPLLPRRLSGAVEQRLRLELRRLHLSPPLPQLQLQRRPLVPLQLPWKMVLWRSWTPWRQQVAAEPQWVAAKVDAVGAVPAVKPLLVVVVVLPLAVLLLVKPVGCLPC